MLLSTSDTDTAKMAYLDAFYAHPSFETARAFFALDDVSGEMARSQAGLVMSTMILHSMTAQDAMIATLLFCLGSKSVDLMPGQIDQLQQKYPGWNLRVEKRVRSEEVVDASKYR